MTEATFWISRKNKPFAFAGYMKEHHTGPTAVLLTSGNVLVAGGTWATVTAAHQR